MKSKGQETNKINLTIDEILVEMSPEDKLKEALAQLDDTISAQKIAAFVSHLPQELKTSPLTDKTYITVIDMFLDKMTSDEGQKED